MAALEKDGFNETGKEKPRIEPTHTPTRIDILSELWTDFQELKEIRKGLADKNRDPTPAVRYAVYVVQVRSQIGRAILYGLKDENLELRIMEMEKKIGEGILIERTRKET